MQLGRGDLPPHAPPTERGRRCGADLHLGRGVLPSHAPPTERERQCGAGKALPLGRSWCQRAHRRSHVKSTRAHRMAASSVGDHGFPRTAHRTGTAVRGNQGPSPHLHTHRPPNGNGCAGEAAGSARRAQNAPASAHLSVAPSRQRITRRGVGPAAGAPAPLLRPGDASCTSIVFRWRMRHGCELYKHRIPLEDNQLN